MRRNKQQVIWLDAPMLRRPSSQLAVSVAPLVLAKMAVTDELSGLDRELSMYPVRAFNFKNAGTVVIEQDVADVGSVVWDAEVLLAHYLDLAYGVRLRGMRVLELGAGTGLAGIVAARLGASVVLTDQSKLLPTLVGNARANAPKLELRTPPDNRPDGLTAEKRFGDADPTPYAASSPLTAEPPPATAGRNKTACTACRESGEEGVDAPGGRDTCRIHGMNRSGVGPGSWRVAALLFSERQADLRGFVARGCDWLESDEVAQAQTGPFDLVVAADVVYLNDLWNAMAFTIKALLKPTGDALMTFEQRRSNVDAFFGPPRFGDAFDGDGNAWERGEEIDMGEDGGKGLGDAAATARVRLFRMRRGGGRS